MGFFLSKILPLALFPLGFSLILLCLSLFWDFRFRRQLVFTAAFLLWFFSLGLVSQSLWRLLELPWQRRLATEAEDADAIVVLSGGRHPVPGSSRLTEWHDPDRFLAGVDLYFAGKAPLLFFTGGSSPFYPGQAPEGDFYIHEAASLGIPFASMASTPPVSNTLEEAISIRRLLPARRPRVLLVTSAFHMRRAKHLFELQGLKVSPFPVDFQSRALWAGPPWRDPTQWLPSAHALDQSSRALRELLGRLVYRIW